MMARPPDHEGPVGCFWEYGEINLSPISFLIRSEGQALAWSHYLLALLDLKGIDASGKTAYLDFPDARWEFAVFALADDPETGGIKPDPDNPETTQRYLVPQNVRVQVPDHPRESVISATRALAIASCDGVIRLEPWGSSSVLSEEWRLWIEATLEHPYHGGDRG